MTENQKTYIQNLNRLISTQKVTKTSVSPALLKFSQRKASLLQNSQHLPKFPFPHNYEQSLISLPTIAKKKKIKKSGSYLEMWLDQALGAPDAPAKQQKSNSTDKTEMNALSTLKKFQLDKGSLKSKNIPQEKIQRMYESLYIYSHGVNKVFEQIIQFAKKTDNNDLVRNFWRAYSKLLEGCTSYQTVFQKVEKDHLTSIRNLQHSIEVKNEMLGQEKKQLVQQIRSLQKTVQQTHYKYNQLSMKYDVLEKTFHLTDKAFNEEVSLRLKFEEKINAIYTTYEELKRKYLSITEDVEIKHTDIVGRLNIEGELKTKLLSQRTKIEQLMFLLKIEKDKVQQRNKEIIIKNKEILDVKAELLVKSAKQDTAQDKIQQHESRYKAMNNKLIQKQNVISGLQLTIKLHLEHIQKLSGTLEQYKQYNEQVYRKYGEVNKKIGEFQTLLKIKEAKIGELEQVIRIKMSEIVELKKQIQNEGKELSNLQEQLRNTNKNLIDTKLALSKNSALAEQLRSVKDKYQRINQIVNEQLKQLQQTHNKTTKELALKAYQCEGFKMLVDTKNKVISQIEKQSSQLKQTTKNKHSAFQSATAKKVQLAMQYQKMKEQLLQQLKTKNIQLKQLSDKYIELESSKTNLQIQLVSKTKILQNIEQFVRTQNTKYKYIIHKLQQQMKQKFDIIYQLQSAQFLIKSKSQEERTWINMLEGILESYKIKILQKVQYVHPMVHEDLLGIVSRYAKCEDMKKNGEKIENVKENIKEGKAENVHSDKQLTIYQQSNRKGDKCNMIKEEQIMSKQLYGSKCSKQVKQKGKIQKQQDIIKKEIEKEEQFVVENLLVTQKQKNQKQENKLLKFYNQQIKQRNEINKIPNQKNEKQGQNQQPTNENKQFKKNENKSVQGHQKNVDSLYIKKQDEKVLEIKDDKVFQNFTTRPQDFTYEEENSWQNLKEQENLQNHKNNEEDIKYLGNLTKKQEMNYDKNINNRKKQGKTQNKKNRKDFGKQCKQFKQLHNRHSEQEYLKQEQRKSQKHLHQQMQICQNDDKNQQQNSCNNHNEIKTSTKQISNIKNVHKQIEQPVKINHEKQLNPQTTLKKEKTQIIWQQNSHSQANNFSQLMKKQQKQILLNQQIQNSHNNLKQKTQKVQKQQQFNEKIQKYTQKQMESFQKLIINQNSLILKLQNNIKELESSKNIVSEQLKKMEEKLQNLTNEYEKQLTKNNILEVKWKTQEKNGKSIIDDLQKQNTRLKNQIQQLANSLVKNNKTSLFSMKPKKIEKQQIGNGSNIKIALPEIYHSEQHEDKETEMLVNINKISDQTKTHELLPKPIDASVNQITDLQEQEINLTITDNKRESVRHKRVDNKQFIKALKFTYLKF